MLAYIIRSGFYRDDMDTEIYDELTNKILEMEQEFAFGERDNLAAESPLLQDYAEIWQAADKIVYSQKLDKVTTARTRIERDFDPEAVRHLKVTSGQDLLIGGPNLAAHAFRARLVDECHLFLVSIVVGGGKRSLPNNVHLELELQEERRFDSDMVSLRYRIKP